MRSLMPIRRRVAKGSSWWPDSNTATTCGTTYASRKDTMAQHRINSTMGYTSALLTCWPMTWRDSV